MFAGTLIAGSFLMLINVLPKLAGSILVIPLIFIIMVFFQLFPVVVLLESATALGCVRIMFVLFKEKSVELLRYFLSIMLISLLTVIIVAPLGAAADPTALKKLLMPLLQGFSSALVTIISVIFYLEVKTRVRADA